MCISVTACRNNTSHSPTNSSEIPVSREEAIAFMHRLDETLRITTDDTNVIRNIRSQMKSRLLSAGLSQSEIEAWIGSPINH
jgi:hypothetical protein